MDSNSDVPNDEVSHNVSNEKSSEHENSDSHKKNTASNVSKLVVVFIVNLLLGVALLIMSVVTKSITVLGEAFNALIDLVALVLPLLLIIYKHNNIDPNMKRNYKRLDNLLVNINSGLVIGYRLIIVQNSVVEIIATPSITQALLLIIFGSIGIVVKILSAALVPDTDEGSDVDKGQSLKFYLILDFALDAIGSLAVLVLGIQLYLTNNNVISKYIDSIFTISISIVYIAISSRAIIKLNKKIFSKIKIKK